MSPHFRHQLNILKQDGFLPLHEGERSFTFVDLAGIKHTLTSLESDGVMVQSEFPGIEYLGNLDWDNSNGLAEWVKEQLPLYKTGQATCICCSRITTIWEDIYDLESVGLDPTGPYDPPVKVCPSCIDDYDMFPAHK